MRVKMRTCVKWTVSLLITAQLLWYVNYFSQAHLSSRLFIPTSHTPCPSAAPVFQLRAIPREGQPVSSWAPARRYACSMLLTERDTHDPGRYFLLEAHPLNWVELQFSIQPFWGICNGRVDLVVLVPSQVRNPDRRDIIRKTWGSVSFGKLWPHAKVQNKVIVLFLMGKPFSEMQFNTVEKEAKEYGDVIVGDFYDTYRNLTNKILTGLTWVSTHCPGASYVAKVDDDVFLNVELTMSQVKRWFNSSKSQNTILGQVMCAGDSIVYRKNTSKFSVQVSQYPFEYYPAYVSGGHYILPGQLLPRLINASRYMPVLPIEDAYITGVLGRVLNVTHVTLPRILIFGYPSPETSVSSCYLSVHDVSEDMTKIWTLLKNNSQNGCSEVLLNHQLQTCSQQCRLHTRIVVH